MSHSFGHTHVVEASFSLGVATLVAGRFLLNDSEKQTTSQTSMQFIKLSVTYPGSSNGETKTQEGKLIHPLVYQATT